MNKKIPLAIIIGSIVAYLSFISFADPIKKWVEYQCWSRQGSYIIHSYLLHFLSLIKSLLPFILGGVVCGWIISESNAWKKIWGLVLLFTIVDYCFPFIFSFFTHSLSNKNSPYYSSFSVHLLRCNFLPCLTIGYIFGLGGGLIVKEKRWLYSLVFGIGFLLWKYLTQQIRIINVGGISLFSIASFNLIYIPSITNVISIGLGGTLGGFSWYYLQKVSINKKDLKR